MAAGVFQTLINKPVVLAAAVLTALSAPAVRAWEPSKPVEFVVPAGTGGGADQMARFIQGVVAKNKLMAQPIIVVNKSGGAGAEGFLDVKGDKGNPHKIIITLSNLFTTPLATGVPFNWRDLTPVQMLALDQFVLWRHADRACCVAGVRRPRSGRGRVGGFPERGRFTTGRVAGLHRPGCGQRRRRSVPGDARRRVDVGQLADGVRRSSHPRRCVLCRRGDGDRHPAVRRRDRTGGDAIARCAADGDRRRNDQAGADHGGRQDRHHPVDGDDDHVRAHPRDPTAVRRARRRRHLGDPVRDPPVHTVGHEASGVPRRRPRRGGRSAV